MGKRSDFARIDKDKYLTPYSAVPPLLPFLAPATRFVELCAGDGRLVGHLEQNGHICLGASDIQPDKVHVRDRLRIETKDALKISEIPCNMIITNPPWTRSILIPMIQHFVTLGESWLLFDSNWANNLKAGPIGKAFCREIVPIGRVKWIEGSKHSAKDDCSWYRFSAAPGPTIFHFRAEKVKIKTQGQ